MDVSIIEVYNHFSHWLKQVEKGEIVRITRRGVPVTVLIDHEDFERLRQVQAYFQVTSLSHRLQESNVSAQELHRASRDELDGLT